MKKGIIFDVKRYAIHDGPGIRTTVFLKGCPLRCQWCQNPEGLELEPEVFWRENRCAEDCSACVTACPSRAISKDGSRIVVDTKKCDFCGSCEEACVYDALEIVGREVSVGEMMEEIEKDRVFFDESGGGVTFSGGEPLLQVDFLESLMEEAKKSSIHVALDTSGYIPFQDLERISDRVDLFLYDLKIVDDEKHKKYTGVSNQIILENLKKLSERKKAIHVRIPLVSGVNDDNQSIRMFAEHLRTLQNDKNISLLAYHRGGCEKYRRLQKEEPLMTFQSPSKKRIEEAKDILVDSGFSVRIGG
ncbi:MAG: glycyl-radical enzyme activating protein [Candidatus Aminicenantes bacterium]|jgi:pyruvate formate lyase activating enzyme